MKKAVFVLSLLSIFSVLPIRAQENTGLLDPAYQLLWKIDGQVIKFDTSLLGISEDASGTIYLLWTNGEFKEITRDQVRVLEEAGTKSEKIFQYQIGKGGKIATLRTDGTVEINFKALSEKGEDGYTKALNHQIVFSSEDGLWVIQDDASLYQWSKVENQWKFIIQDTCIRSIVAIDDALYSIREITDGGQTYFEIGKLRDVSLLGGGPSAKWVRVNLENIFKDSHTALRTLGFDGTHLVIFTEKKHHPYDYKLTRVPLTTIGSALPMDNAAPYGLDAEPVPAEAAETIPFELSKTPPSRAGLRLMTPKGMMCQHMDYWGHPQSSAQPSLTGALEHLEAKALDLKGVPISSLPPSEIVDKAVREILGDLSSGYQYDILLRRLKRKAKASVFPEEPLAQVQAREGTVNTQTLEALRVCLEVPQLRRMILERMGALFLEAQKQGRKFLK